LRGCQFGSLANLLSLHKQQAPETYIPFKESRTNLKKKTIKTYFTIRGASIPVHIFYESRRNIRFAIGKKAVLARFPVLLPKKQQTRHLRALQEWTEQQFQLHPELQNRFFFRHYANGDTLQVGDRTYQISMREENRKTHGATLEGRIIHLRLSNDEGAAQRRKAVRTLISRIVAADFLPEIRDRVYELNKLYFQKPIRKVSLKYNVSNWGSCSSKGNINLSTRLLFAPKEVIDYVIIHELAHLVELNHSRRFWLLVETVMPDYEEKEEWLKKNGHLCEF
jgi:predicted metal-dependent hydrolase